MIYSVFPFRKTRSNLLIIIIFSAVLLISIIHLNDIEKQEEIIINQLENNKNIVNNFSESNILNNKQNDKEKVINNNTKDNNVVKSKVGDGKIHDDAYYIDNYKGGDLEPEWEWVKKISILYTWVDGSDTDFLEEKAKYNGGERDINSRFRSADELRYSIRSVEKYLPWHEGEIIIFTAQQVPQWLNTTNSRVRMVYHKDVMPKHVIPTYDSGVIELYLDKIPGITEQFLFLNDDFFINNYVHPAFFFTTKEHYPKTYLEREIKFDKKKVDRELNRNDMHNSFYATSYFTNLIIKKYFDPKFKYYYLEHTVYVFYRDLMEPFRQLLEDELKVTITDRFRNPYEPHSLYLFLMFQHYVTQHKSFPRRFGGKGKARYFKGYQLPENRTIKKYGTILSYPEDHEGRIKFGRINDNIKANRDEMIHFKTHPEILAYNFNDRYTKEEALYQFSEYMITRYPWPTPYEKKKYVELENLIISQLNKIEKMEAEEYNNDESEDNITSEDLLNRPLFQKKLGIVKEYIHFKDTLEPRSNMSTREREEIDALQSYSEGNEPLGDEWKWVENISIVYVFDKTEVMEIRKLKYSVQSIIKYLSWFQGKIFIVIPEKSLESKLESLVNEDANNQIQIITSDKIVPRKYRRKCTVHTIEMYLDQIPGISERFIYLNQNQFFIKYTHPRLFFSNEGFYPKYNLQPALTRKEMRSQRRNDRAFYNTFKLIENYFGRSYVHHWRFLKNAPIPLYRDLFEPVRRVYTNELHRAFNRGGIRALLPIYLVINYNIYGTNQVYYPKYVSGYGKIKEVRLPRLNSERSIAYYGFDETSIFVEENSMITDLPLTESICNNEEFNERRSKDNILFLSIFSTNELENENEVPLDLYYLTPYLEEECLSTSDTKVSVILPTYNSGEYLENGIKAILDQTLEDIELIVVNDGSTDNTEEVLRKYEDESKVTIINLHNHEGLGRGKNIGMEIAKGEFIGFMGADDFVDEKFYESLYQNSEDKDVVVGYLVDCISDSYHCAYNQEQKEYDQNMNSSKNKKKAYGYVSNSIWRKEFLDKKKLKFSLKPGVLEDKLFRKDCYRQKPRITKVPDEDNK
ncbi:hypothetical protein BCR32DRAFT_268962 [Anaeromyces robustus]|uniref:Glycosyltransferase 2-like domain-containing protein n=1 Tax=Anaeromyces robustus TaxID=1754192 RepID=A0A1Y1X347_9FUNG|nr:hypothetical protein BCR32DRAFT_268962 [Anaeromyces robustus]|eukprot:ORX80227.1 hypothetical protein BCR32DRAFT_268962 [Anaeromyces robustus]